MLPGITLLHITQFAWYPCCWLCVICAAGTLPFQARVLHTPLLKAATTCRCNLLLAAPLLLRVMEAAPGSLVFHPLLLPPCQTICCYCLVSCRYHIVGRGRTHWVETRETQAMTEHVGTCEKVDKAAAPLKRSTTAKAKEHGSKTTGSEDLSM